MEPFAADGTVQAVGPGRIQMLTNSNQNWMIFIDPKATVHVMGTAKADFLRVGMFIRFSVALDKRGKAQGKVGDLMIFTPTPQNFVGAWPEAAGAGPPDPAGDGGEAGDRPPVQSSNYTIAGQIRGSRRGKITVNYGQGMVDIELDENPSIKVDFADYTVARQGNKISVKRGKMYPGRPGMAQATELTIMLSDPLTLNPPKPKRPARP